MTLLATRWFAPILLSCGVSVGACGDSETPAADTRVDTADTADTGTTEVSDTDVADAEDTRVDAPDTADTALADTEDTTSPGPIQARSGESCPDGERVGLVQLESQGTVYVSAEIHDRANPQFGPPETSAGVCDFHRFRPGDAGCPACSLDEVCGRSGQCSPVPQRRRDVTLVLAVGEDTQTLTSEPEYGDLWGTVTLAGRTFAATLTFGDVEVTLPATEIPNDLEAVQGTLQGGYDDPEGLSVTWTPVNGDSLVTTLVPMNHHVREPTYTSCRTPASTGTLSIPGDMLKPLAVVTGLEFQGLEHTRVAAATTPLGCIEFRFLTRAYVSL